MTTTSSDHEFALGYFIVARHRKRFRESLSDPERRNRELWKLHDSRYLELRFATPVRGNERWPSNLAAALRRSGAPDLCHVVGNHDLDGQTVVLEDALDALCGDQTGAFLSCIPGRLAYYHGEHHEDRYILVRPRDGM